MKISNFVFSFAETHFRNGVQDKGTKVLFLPFCKTGFRNGIQDKGIKVLFLPFCKTGFNTLLESFKNCYLKMFVIKEFQNVKSSTYHGTGFF